MSSGTSRTEPLARVMPIQALGRTALLSGAFSLLPVFAVVCYLTRQSSCLVGVLVAEAVVAIVFMTVYIRFRRVYSAVDHTHFHKRRMLLPPTAIERSRLDRLLVNRIYRSGSTHALTQLLGVDALGRRVLAMSGLFWTDADIQAVIDALDVKTVVDTMPMSRRDYYRAFPTAREWYRSRPVFVSLVVVAGALIFVAVMALQQLSGQA